MMNRLLLSAAVLGLAMPAAAWATEVTPVTGTVDVNGSVAPRCQFTTGTATITIAELSDTTTGQLDTTKVDGQSKDLVGWCNGTNSSMTVNAASLVNATPPIAPSGFSNQIDYTAKATANSQTATDSDSTDGLAGSPATVGIFTGSITVALSGSSTHGGSTLKLVAGSYSGSVLVTLTPSL